MVDFIGIGAQKSGTSWVYACLYEHPEVCAPIKELHFFSRDRFSNGQRWYENHFSKCDPSKKIGEFSTSYLYDRKSPERIAKMYPDAKLIAIVRNPIDRAYSQYKNAIKAGEVPKQMSFETYIAQVPSAKEQGLYARQLQRYFDYYSTLQLQVLIYEDAKADPLAFIKTIYEHLEIATDFVPDMLEKYVNVERTPRFVFIERWMQRIAEGLRKIGLDKLVFWFKKQGVGDAVRSVNTHKSTAEEKISKFTRIELQEYFRPDAVRLSAMVGRDLVVEWGLEEVTEASV